MNIQSSENLTILSLPTCNHIIKQKMNIESIILKIFVTNIFIKSIIVLFHIKHVI